MNADARKRPVKVLLWEIHEGDEVAITVDETEYRGEVSYKHYEDAEYHDGVPVPGRLSMDVDLSNDSLEETDAPTHQLSVHARETKPGHWHPATAALWNPDVEDGELVEENYDALGTISRVEEAA